MLSGNTTNFVAAIVTADKEWRFNLPYVPHFGGALEI